LKDTVEITAQLIEEGRSPAGGWSKAQLALLGVEWPPVKGWKEAAIGKAVLEGSASAFVKMKGLQ